MKALDMIEDEELSEYITKINKLRELKKMIGWSVVPTLHKEIENLQESIIVRCGELNKEESIDE